MIIDRNSAKTPPSLFGIDRKIAYANKKYHSGWICTGVTIGLAGVKLSGSERRKGFDIVKIISKVIVIQNPMTSLIEKNGWNGILSKFELTPMGFLEPVRWRKNKWIIVSITIINGNIKCSLKNRDNVALSTLKPPQIQFTKVGPTYGNADNRFVITVAPQNDICPHGNTYPKNAVAIVASIIIIPIFHVFIKWYDP